MHFDVPGAGPSSIDLTVEKTCSPSRRSGSGYGPKATRCWCRNPQGSFIRQLFLGESLDADRIQANDDNGVPTISVPVAEQAKPRRVEISSAKAINADSTAA